MPHSALHSARITLRPLSGGPSVALPVSGPAPLADPNITLEQWLELWMDRDIEQHRADTTIGGYRNIIQNHLIPALGAVRLSCLTPALIDSYYQWLAEEKSLSPNTIRKHHILLHTALSAACRRGVLSTNPVQRATPPRATCTDIHYYTPAQLSRLLDEVEGLPLELPVKLACCLGLRRSEVLGLRWRDVDLQAGLLTIRRARTTVGARVVEKEPKTADSLRTLSISALDDLLALLRRLYAVRLRNHLPCGPDDFLVLNRRGQPWHPNALSTALSTFAAERQLPPITLHGLRHTFASVANIARIPMYQISRAMGHSNPNVTQRIYTHLFDQTHGEVLAAVANVVKASTSSQSPLRSVSP